MPLRGRQETQRAAGVLSLDTVLAEEHDRLHGDAVRQQLVALTLEFDASQVIDAGGLFQALRDAWRRLQPGSAGSASDARANTPVDHAAAFLLGGSTGAITPALRQALQACIDERTSGTRDPARVARADAALADVFVARLNALMAERLDGEPCFQPFLDAGCLQALDDGQTPDQRMVNRLLIEAVFPTQLAKLRDRRLEVVHAAVRRQETAALCLSGGGIRSATFALGVLRGLAKHGLLSKFDYLSTVSGGGFIGGWLSTWMRRAGATTVQRELGRPGTEKLNPEPAPVRHLRAYSHYLTPRVGALSADTWTLTATLLRNLLLNWLVLVPLMAAMVLVPRLLVALISVDYHELSWLSAPAKNASLNAVLVLGVLLAVVALRFAHQHGDLSGDVAGDGRDRASQREFLAQCLVPLVASAMLLSGYWYVWWTWSRSNPEMVTILWRAREAAPALVNPTAGLASALHLAREHPPTLIAFVTLSVAIMVGGWVSAGRSARQLLRESIPILLTAMLAGVILMVGAVWFITLPAGPARERLYVSFAPPAFLSLVLLGTMVFSGWTSTAATDARREWSARFDAWLLIVIAFWCIGCAIVLFGPELVGVAWQQLTLLSVGTVTGIATVVLGRSQATVVTAPSTVSFMAKARRAALAAAAPAFAVSIIIGLAWANERLIQLGCDVPRLSTVMGCRPVAADSAALTRALPLRVLSMHHTERAESLSTHFGGTGADAALFTRLEEVAQGSRDRAADLRARSAAALGWLTQATGAIDSLVQRARRADADLIARSAAFRNAVTVADSVTLLGIAADSTLRSLVTRRQRAQARVSQVLAERFDNRDTLFRDADTVLRAVSLASDSAAAERLQHITASFVTRVASALEAEAAVRADSVVQVTTGRRVQDALAQQARARPVDPAVPLTVAVLFAVLVGFALLMGWRIDTNKFSMHGMYHARLVRAYLGASRPLGDRSPNPFTGFDPSDDIAMRDLFPARGATASGGSTGVGRSEQAPPLHLVNLTLNLVSGRNLAWQQRKAASMTVSPLHAGSAFLGYRRTSPGGDGRTPGLYGGDPPITLGTAVTISGAAASPNAGYHSSPLVTFLMTLFNARLGSWLGNPGPAGHDTYTLSAPAQHLRPIVSEMFGLTTDDSPYVYLSDGGHFENLALYEMVQRRCRFILVSDAGCDPTCSFEDLGNAVRKVRVDFGVPIEFPNDISIRARGSADAGPGAYWAIGRIRYSDVDMKGQGRADDYDGVLIYIKPAVYGQEPRDVFNYAQTSPTFPHESTTDQFFSESQFESYRALGEHIVDQLVSRPPVLGDPIIPGRRAGSLLKLWPDLSAALPRAARPSLISPHLTLPPPGGAHG